MKKLCRSELLGGAYQWPGHWIQLRWSAHARKAIEERGLAQNSIPTVVRISKDNIYSGRTEDGKTLNSVVIGLKYSYRRFLFLALDPVTGTLKTLWFRNEQFRGRNRQSAVCDSGAEAPVDRHPKGWDGGLQRAA
jgi:hypothetical protein